MRLLTIVSGGMLIMTSLFCYANPGETFLALAFVLGLAMILTGLVQVAAYWWGRDSRRDNNGWIFAEALMTVILGVLVITSLIAADAAIPMVFGLWVIFSGALRIVVATMIDPKSKKKNFFWTMATGLICILTGLYAFINPLIANVSIAVLLGILFMIQGVCTMELGIHMPHEKKEAVKKPKAKTIKIQIKKPVKKKTDKKTALFTPITDMKLDAVKFDEGDVKKFMTEEIKLDDIRAALEFNFASEEETEKVSEENTVEQETDTTDIMETAEPEETEKAAEEIADGQETEVADITETVEAEENTETAAEETAADAVEKEEN